MRSGFRSWRSWKDAPALVPWDMTNPSTPTMWTKNHQSYAVAPIMANRRLGAADQSVQDRGGERGLHDPVGTPGHRDRARVHRGVVPGQRGEVPAHLAGGGAGAGERLAVDVQPPGPELLDQRVPGRRAEVL